MQFRPPLEELRAGYYREMKKFISIPSLFTGFGNAEVFAPMAERNAASLTQVYRKVRARACMRSHSHLHLSFVDVRFIACNRNLDTNRHTWRGRGPSTLLSALRVSIVCNRSPNAVLCAGGDLVCSLGQAA